MSEERKYFFERYGEFLDSKKKEPEQMPLWGKLYLASCGMLVIAAVLELVVLIIHFLKLI